MKRLVVMLTLGASLVGCVENESSIVLLGSRPVNAECSGLEGNVDQTAGSLDLAAFDDNGILPGYVIGFNFESNLEQVSTTVGGVEFGGPERADVVFEEVQLEYATQPALPNPLPPERLPLRAVVRAGAAATSFIIVDLVGEQAAFGLLECVQRGGPPITLLVTLKLKGERASGGSIESTEATFPIRVSSSPACETGTRPATGGVCGLPPGQDAPAPPCT
jgi:hypothetical protein